MIGGSGAVEAIVTLRSLRCADGAARRGPAATRSRDRSRRRPRRPRAIAAGFALSNSFGFGGMNTALVLRPPANDAQGRDSSATFGKPPCRQRLRVDGDR